MNRITIVLALLVLVTGCGPKMEHLQVVHFGQWEMGEVKSCLRASGDNLLFCDLDIYRERIEKNQTERNAFDKGLNNQAPPMTPQDGDRLDQEANDIEYIATHGKTFAVTFPGKGIPQTDAKDQHDLEADAKQRLEAKRITKWVAEVQLATARYLNNATKWTCRKTVDGIRCE